MAGSCSSASTSRDMASAGRRELGRLKFSGHCFRASRVPMVSCIAHSCSLRAPRHGSGCRASAASPEVRLVPTKAGGQPHRVAKPSFVVGSGPSAEVKLSGPSVAAEHARFDWRGSKLFLTDLESAAGTKYDGARLMPGVAYVTGAGAVVDFGGAPNTFVLELDVQGKQGSSSIEAALARSFLAKFQASGSAEVQQALKDQQL